MGSVSSTNVLPPPAPTLVIGFLEEVLDEDVSSSPSLPVSSELDSVLSVPSSEELPSEEDDSVFSEEDSEELSPPSTD